MQYMYANKTLEFEVPVPSGPVVKIIHFKGK